jgi:hypothetical protein
LLKKRGKKKSHRTTERRELEGIREKPRPMGTVIILEHKIFNEEEG